MREKESTRSYKGGNNEYQMIRKKSLPVTAYRLLPTKQKKIVGFDPVGDFEWDIDDDF